MAIAFVQHKDRNIGGGDTITLDATPTVGNTLILWMTERDSDGDPADPAGFTAIEAAVRTEASSFSNRWGKMWYRVVVSGDDATYSTTGWSSAIASLSEWSGISSLYDSASQNDQNSATISAGGSITAPGDGRDVLVIGGAVTGGNNVQSLVLMTPAAGTTELSEMCNNGTSPPRSWVGYKIVTSASGSKNVGATLADSTSRLFGGITAMFVAGGTAPVADFTADLTSGVVPTTVCFIDTSTGVPTSWAWTFGDGGTSTSQNPCHAYTAAGTYSVTLTATNASGSDAETKTAYITVSLDVGYEEPLPGMALVEIYAAEPGAARWDVATWDDDVWSTGAWQDVTPESVEANILWGSNRPELGILSKPDAGSWTIDMYDPVRLLDPANEDGPFFTDLLPGLPVRITHRGIVIRQGIAEAITHEFDDDSGIIRVQDNIARMANADVESDSTLPDTLYARAVAAIEAAGLAVTVLPPPPSGDPDVAPWETGVNEWTVWQWITDAAEQALHIAYVDRIGRLGFRAWAEPLSRGRTLDATELIGLTSIVQYNGLVSQVTALDSFTDTVEVRAITPPPRYGVRTYSRTDPTLDAGDWAEAVLLDRAVSGLRWVPGTMYPLTANSVELLATIEAVELIGLTHAYTDPGVLANLVVVGGGIRITAKKDDEAKWWFTFEAAQVTADAFLPLITEDGLGFVVDETSGIDYLYPE